MTSWRLGRRMTGWMRWLGHGGARTAVSAVSCICVVTLGAACLALLPRASAAGRPPGGRLSDPVVRAVDVAQPAIVRLATIYTAHITLSLCGQDVTLPASGSGYTLGATGSGAFISANGDILTADHVVDVPQDLLDQAIFEEQTAAEDIAHVLNTNPGCHATQSISASDVAAGYVQYAGISYTVHYSTPRHLVWQSTAFTGAISNTAQNSTLEGLLAVPYQSATVLSSSSFNDNDLAIVHVGMSDTPSIQLDNSTSVAVDDQLTIIGYPGNGDVTNDGTNLLTPSVNDITVSAIKSGDNGEPLIQVGGNVEHGDSGGPALDAQGHIVGIVSFGFVGPNSPGSTAFLRSSNSVRSLIAGANVTTTPGAFERAWEAAFTDYAATYPGHWHKAAGELDVLNTRYPSFHGIQPFREYADSAASLEAQPVDSTSILAIAGGAGVVLVLIVLVALLLLAQRHTRQRKRQLAYAPAGQGQPALPYGGAYPYGYVPAPYGPARPYGPPTQRPEVHGAMPSAAPVPLAQSPAAYGAGYTYDSMRVPASASYPVPPLDAPMGRMPSDPNRLSQAVGRQAPLFEARQSGNSWLALDGTQQGPATGAGGTQAAAGYGSSGYAAGAAETAARYGYCASGHPLSPNEQYCAHCGAPRWTGSVS